MLITTDGIVIRTSVGEISLISRNTQGVMLMKTEEGDRLMVQILNRDQTRMSVYSCNPKSSMTHLFYEEQSDKYFTDYALWDEWQWLRNGQLVMLSEKDGWRRAYLYNAQGTEQKVLTPPSSSLPSLFSSTALP